VTTSVRRPDVPVRELFGIPVAALTMEQALDLVDRSVRARESLQIGVVNAAKVVNMRRDRLLREDVLSSDVILADGAPVVWASRMLGCSLPERVAGIDLMMGILARGRNRGYRVYCLGATPEVLDAASARIVAECPGLELVGRHHGYFTSEEEPALARDIAATRADVLFIAMTSPRKEEFLARWGRRLGVSVCHGVGGSFDVLAGKVRRAPPAWQRLGLEWLYRVKQEPRRLWRRYLVTNTLFCVLLAREVLGQIPRVVARVLFAQRAPVPPGRGVRPNECASLGDGTGALGARPGAPRK
jgi:N-acetylglucosaminyldiphosphoundecaprenol N-acetyl-beta-D-mannosaminyltransferase